MFSETKKKFEFKPGLITPRTMTIWLLIQYVLNTGEESCVYEDTVAILYIFAEINFLTETVGKDEIQVSYPAP